MVGELGGDGARGDVVRSGEGREEVVEGDLVGEVDDGDGGGEGAFVGGLAAQEVVLAEGEVGGLAGRRAITLYNLGSAQVRICTSASCGSGNSFPLDPGMSMALDVTDAIALCCGAASAQTAGSGLRYLEVR